MLIEDTNQLQEEQTPAEQTTETAEDDLFDDDLFAEDTTPEESEETPETVTESKEDTTPTLKVKFLGEDKEISMDEAIPLVQKGMNYDHVNGELEKAKNSPAMKLVETLAKENGMSVDDYITASNAQLQQNKVSGLVGKGYSQEEAQRVLNLERENAELKEVVDKKKSEQTAAETRQKVLSDFISEYPNVKTEQWTDEMKAAYNEGKDITGLWRKEENRQLKAENEALKKNNQNKEKQIGSVKGNNPTNTDSDAFLSGLFG